MAVDISPLGLPELLALRDEVETRIATVAAEAKVAAWREMKEVAARHGLDLGDVIEVNLGTDPEIMERAKSAAKALAKANAKPKSASGAATKKDKAHLVPKYQHPDDPNLTWHGQGRQPQWVKDHIEGGGPKDDLLIDKEAA